MTLLTSSLIALACMLFSYLTRQDLAPDSQVLESLIIREQLGNEKQVRNTLHNSNITLKITIRYLLIDEYKILVVIILWLPV